MGLKSYMFLALLVVGCTVRMAPGLEERKAEAGAAAGGSARPHVFASDSDPSGNGYGSVELDRTGNGHFYTDAKVNGVPVRFIVDTGASIVALTPEDAQRIGIGGGNYSAMARGVGGDVRVKPVTLKTIEIGPMRTAHVSGVVTESSMGVSLLGQSYLARLQSVEMRGDTMVLTN